MTKKERHEVEDLKDLLSNTSELELCSVEGNLFEQLLIRVGVKPPNNIPDIVSYDSQFVEGLNLNESKKRVIFSRSKNSVDELREINSRVQSNLQKSKVVSVSPEPTETSSTTLSRSIFKARLRRIGVEPPPKIPPEVNQKSSLVEKMNLNKSQIKTIFKEA